MAKTYIADIRDRAAVSSIFLVKEKITAMAKNGKPYLTVRLMDRSGEIEGRIWDNVDTFGSIFERDDFIEVRGKASVYLGKMQLIISELTRIPEEDVALVDFLPESSRSSDEMVEELLALVSGLSDPHLRELMESFVSDQAFLTLYRTAPAAKGMHHVYLGGLLEHSLAVARLVDGIVPLYEGLNRDLLVTGALLHDVGKVREMTFIRSFDYTDEGKLLGHITIGVEMIQERLALLPGFPPSLAMLLKHMILSHHGQYEFGSPKRPKTVEATILNYLDDLDSKINGIRSHIRKEPESTSRWTAYHRLYDRYFFKDSGFTERADDAVVLDDEVPETPAEPVAERQLVQGEFDRPASADRQKFHNNPFLQLKGANLNLFND